MFSPAHPVSLSKGQRLYTPPTPPSAAQRRVISALRGLLMIGVASLSIFTAGRIFFAGVPLGGASDLVTLYAATAALAIGLAGLLQLKSAEEDGVFGSGSGGGSSHRISGVFRKTGEESFRFLTRALSAARAG